MEIRARVPHVNPPSGWPRAAAAHVHADADGPALRPLAPRPQPISLRPSHDPSLHTRALSLGVTALAAVGAVWSTPTADDSRPVPKHPPTEWLQGGTPTPMVRMDPLMGSAPPSASIMLSPSVTARLLEDLSRKPVLGPVYDPTRMMVSVAGHRAVALARTHAGVISSALRGHLAYFQAAGGETNNCADFVSSILQSEGLLSHHYVWVPTLEQGLRAEGYQPVAARDAEPGDVFIQADRMHTQIVTAPGGQMVIGSNNSGRTYQMVSEGPPLSTGVYYHKTVPPTLH